MEDKENKFRLIGEYIAHLRENKNLTQEQLAIKTKVTRVLYSKIETNVVYPSEKNIQILKNVFEEDWNDDLAKELLEKTKLMLWIPNKYDEYNNLNEYNSILENLVYAPEEYYMLQDNIDKYKLIGNYICDLRISQKMSVEEFAKVIGTTPSKLVKIEASKTLPTENNLYMMSKLFSDYNEDLAHELIERTTMYIDFPNLYKLFVGTEKELHLLRKLLSKRK